MALLKEFRDIPSPVDDSNEFDPVINSPIEDGVVPDREIPEVSSVFLGARSDKRMRRVKFTTLLELDREAVRGLSALAIKVIEDSFQVGLGLIRANDAGHQVPPFPFFLRPRIFSSVP